MHLCLLLESVKRLGYNVQFHFLFLLKQNQLFGFKPIYIWTARNRLCGFSPLATDIFDTWNVSCEGREIFQTIPIHVWAQFSWQRKEPEKITHKQTTTSTAVNLTRKSQWESCFTINLYFLSSNNINFTIDK